MRAQHRATFEVVTIAHESAGDVLDGALAGPQIRVRDRARRGRSDALARKAAHGLVGRAQDLVALDDEGEGAVERGAVERPADVDPEQILIMRVRLILRRELLVEPDRLLLERHRKGALARRERLDDVRAPASAREVGKAPRRPVLEERGDRERRAPPCEKVASWRPRRSRSARRTTSASDTRTRRRRSARHRCALRFAR